MGCEVGCPVGCEVGARLGLTVGVGVGRYVGETNVPMSAFLTTCALASAKKNAPCPSEVTPSADMTLAFSESALLPAVPLPVTACTVSVDEYTTNIWRLDDELA